MVEGEEVVIASDQENLGPPRKKCHAVLTVVLRTFCCFIPPSSPAKGRHWEREKHCSFRR